MAKVIDTSRRKFQRFQARVFYRKLGYNIKTIIAISPKDELINFDGRQ